MNLKCRLLVALVAVSLAGGLQAAPALRILPLGDSITEATGDYPGGGYRGPLWTLLRNAGYNVDYVGSVTDTKCTLADFDRDHEGHGGWRVDQTYGGNGLYEHLNAWFAGYLDPHVVLLHIGTNDSGSNFGTILARYEALLDRIYECQPDTHVIATTLMWRKAAANMTNIETYFNSGIADLVAAQRAKGRKISLVDMKAAVPGAATSTGAETGEPNFSDGLHPNATGYPLMAQAWFDEIRRIYPTPESVEAENAPAVVQVAAKDTGGRAALTVAFNQPVDLTGASAPANWTVTGARKVAGEAGVVVASDRKSVLVLLEDATPWSSVSVTVPSVRNLNGTKTSAPVTKSVLLKAAQGAAANVPAEEFGKYTLVYDWNLPGNNDIHPHFPTVNRAAAVKKGGFRRVAYFMELEKTDGTYQYAWASMDAFTDDARKLEIPYQGCDWLFQQKVDNLLVYGNVAGLRTGTVIPQGVVEIWDRSYSTGAKLGGLGSDGSAPWKTNRYDWDDVPAAGQSYWGSLQVHDYVGQTTVLSYTGFTKNGEVAGLGIGNNPNWTTGQSPDWTQTKNAEWYTTRRLQVYVELTEPLATTELPPVIAEKVGDKADGYELVYAFDMTGARDRLTTVPYAVDNSAGYGKSFDRVGYFFRLVDKNGAEQWAWTSMDPWTQNPDLIGVPNTAARSKNSFKVRNLEVASNVAGVQTGMFVDGGIVEFWKEGYGLADSLGVGADSSAYDFCDTRSSGDYGTMQVNNYAAKQTVWAFNRWLQGNAPGVGIGNREGATHLDWTEYSNAHTFRTRELYVVVRPSQGGVKPAPQKILDNVEEAKDYNLLYELSFPASPANGGSLRVAANYAAAHLVDNAAVFAGLPVGRVAYYCELAKSDGTTQWCWTSFDAPIQDLARLSIPTNSNVADARIQTMVANLTVRSNVPGVTSRDRVKTGCMEFWGGSFSGGTALGLPGATSAYDFDDKETAGEWGTMQVHDWGAKQCLWSINGFTRTQANALECGIGNATAGSNPDWVFQYNGGSFATRKLYVFVQAGEAPTPQPYPDRVIASRDGRQLCVEYSGRPFDDAADPANFSVAGHAVTNAVVNPKDGREIILSLETPLAKGTDYTLNMKAGAIRGLRYVYSFNVNFRTQDAAMPACLNRTSIPELGSYKVVYELNPPNKGCNYGRKGADYTTDETRFGDVEIKDRIAYLLYLKGTDGVEQWIWTSMDAFTDDADKIGCPGVQRDNRWQCYVNNLFVAAGRSDGQAVPVRTGEIPQGNIEFFKGNYGAGTALGVPGASAGVNDFDDTDNNKTSGGDYTCMQVHDYLAKTTLWAVNSLGRTGQRPGFGIGNNARNSSTDWTFIENANEFEVRRLYILVRVDNRGTMILVR